MTAPVLGAIALGVASIALCAAALVHCLVELWGRP